MIYGVQVFGDTVAVYYGKNQTKINYYNRKGDFIKGQTISQLSCGVEKIGEDFLLCRGLGAENPPNRVILKERESLKLFFEGSKKVPVMRETSPVLTYYNGEENGNFLFLREAFGDTIYMYSVANKKIYPHAVFDFGEWGTGKQYLEFGDVNKSMEYLFAKYEKEGFITSVRYLCGDKIRLGEFLQNKMSQRFIYFYENRNIEKSVPKGIWFTLNNGEKAGFSGTVKCIHNGKLYLFTPSYIIT